MPMPRAPSVRWVTGLPLPVPAVPGGFGVEVAFEDETGTFVALADDGRFARVLLARLAGGVAEHRGLLALTVQRDSIRLPPGAGLDNRDVEGRWQRERARLAELGGRGAAVLVATGAHGGVVDPVALDRRSGR